jgi:mono/diheme cytochrome c family protein
LEESPLVSPRFPPRIPIGLLLPLALGWWSAAAAAGPDFEREVQPILAAHCVKCHGPDKQKGGYRVDAKKIALTGGEGSAPNILPGNSAGSPIIRYVSGADADLRMPPEEEKPLSASEVAVLRAWIDAGANWPDSASAKVADPLDWWSLQPIVKAPPPSGATHPVDAFIRARLAAAGLRPAAPADARTLIRRLYFDLTGLPPTPEEIAAFAADRSPDAYARLVDRLLASPRYGERWARHWLDVVHYGDTHGYDKDKPRPNAWPYRDYVIRALNSDKPYTRFVQEQIAGEVLFPDSPDAVEALGFIAAGPWDFIGHAEVPEAKIDGKIARHLDRDDMVANTIGTFASVTVHCAQCHNHKFDPVPQEDYYRLQAVFSALDRTERPYHRDPAIHARRRALEQSLREKIAALNALETPLRAQAGPALAELERQIKESSFQGTNVRRGYHSAVADTQDTVKWVQVDLGASVEIDRVWLLPASDPYNGIGDGFGFPVRFKVEVSDDPEFRTGVKLAWIRYDVSFMADFPNPGLTPFSTGGSKDDGIAGRHVRVTATRLAPRKGDYVFALAELKVTDRAGNNVALGKPVTSLDSIESGERWSRTNLTDGLAPTSLTAAEKAEREARREELLLAAADAATRARRGGMRQESERLRAEIASLPAPDLVYAGGIHQGTGTFTGTGASGGRPRPIPLLSRGQVTQPGRLVEPGTLSAVTFAPARFDLPDDAPEGARRAALARWLTDPRHPLTWRSIVNRVWQYHFGRGLVDTPNDFGRNGGLPSHPELLDWLAAEFRDGGGSLKALHRLIVTSETYRQASAGDAAGATVDTGNALLWRQNRRRLEAEAIRDSVLAVSGRLDLKMGGPGWQDFVIERPEHSPQYVYAKADPEDPATFRRSIYRFIVRSQTQPWMTSLDCADPSMRVDRRSESLSPLQALALLNNGFMLTQARHFAARVAAETPDLAAQVTRAHTLALGRAPSPEEAARLGEFARAHGLPALCRLLVNLNEFLFID